MRNAQQLKNASGAAITRPVSFRRVFAILLAVAMLFAPIGVNSGAMAMAPGSDHHTAMAETGHCGEQPDKGTDGKPVDKSCCVAMCTAIAVAPVAAAEPLALASSAERPSLSQFEHGFLAELPTPPPRHA